MEEKEKYCKKICFKSYEEDKIPRVLYGLILQEDDNFLIFKTDNKEYRISKKVIISIQDTDRVFREGV